MDNKEKLHKKYVNQKIFLINTVLYEIFKRNRNVIKKLLWTPLLQLLLNPGQGEKIMQITNVSKIFTTFPTIIKHEKHINNRAKIYENSDEFLRSLVKSLKLKFVHPMKRSMRMLSFRMRNLRGLKNDIFD